jgi:hypothetical protein
VAIYVHCSKGWLNLNKAKSDLVVGKGGMLFENTLHQVSHLILDYPSSLLACRGAVYQGEVGLSRPSQMRSVDACDAFLSIVCIYVEDKQHVQHW